MRRAVPGVLFALAACGGASGAAPPEAPPTLASAAPNPARKLPPEPLSPSAGIGGPTRVNVKPTPIDFAALPEMSSSVLEAGAGFALYDQQVTPKCDPGTVARPYQGWGVRPALPPRTVVDIEGARVPPAMLDGTYDDLGGEISRALGSRGSATWVSVAPVASTDAIDVARYDASFTHTGWRATVTRKDAVRPAELVPRALYAYRRCSSGCDRPLGDPGRTELVGVIGPRALWASSSELAAVRPRSDSFTLAELTLVRGAAASFTIFYERADVDALHDPTFTVEQARPRPPRKPWQDPASLDAIESASIEIVWAEDPELTLYTGLTFAHAAQIEPITPLAFGQPHCVDFQ